MHQLHMINLYYALFTCVCLIPGPLKNYVVIIPTWNGFCRLEVEVEAGWILHSLIND